MGWYLIELPEDALTPYANETDEGLLHGWGEMPRREVVMCRDCAYCYTVDETTSSLFGETICSGFEQLHVTNEESFCSRGKRKAVGK